MAGEMAGDCTRTGTFQPYGGYPTLHFRLAFTTGNPMSHNVSAGQVPCVGHVSHRWTGNYHFLRPNPLFEVSHPL